MHTATLRHLQTTKHSLLFEKSETVLLSSNLLEQPPIKLRKTKWRLTVSNVPLKLKYLWNRNCENNNIKLVRETCTVADFPLPILEGDLRNTVLKEDLSICFEKERPLSTLNQKLEQLEAE